MPDLDLYQGAYTGPQIDAAIAKVQGADATPTTGSTNLVLSGGVKSVLDAQNPGQWGLGGSCVSAPNNDWNAITQTGFFSGNVNAPEAGKFAFGISIRLNTSGSNFAALQIATVSSGLTGVYIREKTSGDQSSGWGAWAKITTT